jgi:hypothetical protein
MAGASNSGARTAKSDGVSTSITGDKTRDKCIEMLYDALALESGFRMSRLVLCPPLTLIGVTYIMPSVRPHFATCPRSRGNGVQGLQRDHVDVQVQDTDVVCKPQRQEQPWLTPKRYSRRYSRPDICKND